MNSINDIKESRTHEDFAVEADGNNDIGVRRIVDEPKESNGRRRDPIASGTAIPEAKSQRNKIGARRGGWGKGEEASEVDLPLVSNGSYRILNAIACYQRERARHFLVSLALFRRLAE